MAIKLPTPNSKLPTQFGKIGVLVGGPSSEREISLKSGKAVFTALKDAGLDVSAIDIITDGVEENIRLIKSHNIDCAFIALHGHFGEDGAIQGILEQMRLPYTGSGVLASKLAMDKVSSRDIFLREHLNVPRCRVLEKSHKDKLTDIVIELGLPLVIKPASNGSSIGLSKIDKAEGLPQAVSLAFSFDQKILIEEYIKGREITVGILDDTPLPAIEIIPKHKFFDYEAKYQAGLTDYVVPAQIDEEILEEASKAALAAHRALGCFGCSRVDIILDEKNKPFILEINTIPGMTATSLLPKAAKTKGIDFTELCLRLVTLAYEKTQSKITV